MPQMPDGYHNRFDPAKNFDAHLFRPGAVQSAEFNEVQSAFAHRIQGVADALFKDGDVIRDARVIINADTGQTTCEAGAVYLHGAVRGIAPKALVIPVVGVVAIGLYLLETVVTEFEDPSLRDPAVGTRNYQEPGAARLKREAVWGYAGDGQTGEFFPVYQAENGILRAKEPPPNLDGVTQALARYDRDSAGGSYVVSGLAVAAAADLQTGEQVYTVSEGRARVNGYGVELATSRRVIYDAAADVREIESEPHTSTTVAAQRIDLDRTPVAAISQVRITKEVTVTLTHGGYTGAQDPLPDSSVLTLLEVKQGSTTYVIGTDCKLTAGKVDWSLTGDEPAPGSTYTAKYQFIATVNPTAVDDTGFTVEGAVVGSLVLVDYSQMLPRYDRLALSNEGELIWIKGVAADWNPQPPAVPANLLPLAAISQTWTASRSVTNDGVRVVPMAELATIQSKLDRMAELIAQQRLTADAQLREAGAKKGLFVDPFLSDDMRDAGAAQSAAVVAGELTLPIAAAAAAVPADVAARTSLAFSLTTTLEQPMRTGSMKVNPYMAFDPIPAAVTLTPAVDRWTELQSAWSSPVTERLTVGSGNRSSVSQSSADVLLSSSRRAIETLRQTAVQFSLAGFGPTEALASLQFDGIDVTPPGLLANGAGVLSGQFTIPAGVPAGAKRVEFVGAGGSRGEAVFVGQGDLQVDTRQQVTRITTTLWWQNTDPLAQTFTINADTQIGGVDLWFVAKGASQVVVQIRETTTGVPNKTVLAEARLQPAAIALAGHTRVQFAAPVQILAGVEHAIVVLCDDADTALAIAELGKWDSAANRWVTSQPYQVGVLLSSSNASTWTPHQDRDMAFRLLAADYTETSRVVALGNVAVADATDLMLLSLADSPSAAARIEYSLGLPDGSSVQVADGQPVRLPVPITGNVTVAAQLLGVARASPVLFPGSQLVSGQVAAAADYVSRAIPAGSNARVRVVFDALIPAGASIAVAAAGVDAGDVYQDVAYQSSTALGDGWMEMTHELASISEAMVRVKLTLGGNSAARPRARNLRVIVM